MDFIKKNKFTLIAIVCFLAFVLVLAEIKNIFFPDTKNAIYGNRLDGIEDVEISKKELASLDSQLEKNENVKESTSQISGKIINVIVTVKDEVPLATAKELSGIYYQEFTKEEQKFYDYQIFIKKESDASDFPIIGYKHHNKESFSWTKDRVENAS